ncbi:hypothetical protein [Streptomyces cavernae]|uniref:hypothetical protein n=1 Tax=Streptomyces cavernae TaxID=2259034 RepID=UPI000FEC1789|nr:hypothetical protein [Streptomyces cavernae]
MHFRRRLAGLVGGVVLLVGAMLALAAPAQAYDPNPSVNRYYYQTSDCPCSGGNLSDPFDGTYFQNDAGGTAVKLELYQGGWFIGKVEFHPNDEKLWVYDTRNDGDSYYVRVQYAYNGTTHSLGTFSPPGTSEVVDYSTLDFDIPEGAFVDLMLYDGSGHTDFFGGAYGTASAVA